MDRSTTDRGDESLAAEAGKGANWKRKRESFSCTKEIWDHAKTAWSVVRSDYPAWTEWLEAALREKAASVQTQLTGSHQMSARHHDQSGPIAIRCGRDKGAKNPWAHEYLQIGEASRLSGKPDT